MFDLDAIEKDWKENSFCLTDKEIRQIYISEGVTNKAYGQTCYKFYNERPQSKYTLDEKLIIHLFGSSEEREKLEEDRQQTNTAVDEYLKNEPKRPYLSHESQMKVVEGSMDIVFKLVRSWHKEYNKLSLEDLYDVALDGLFAAAKYCLHYATADRFRGYARRFIYIQVIKYIAKKEGISYRNAYCIDMHEFEDWQEHSEENKRLYSIREFSYDYAKETPYKPSAIYNMTKDNSYDVDYIKDISSEEFMNTYNKAISELDDTDKKIMGLVYDKDGESILTHDEVADILGIEVNKVINTKRKVKNRLRNDYHFDKFRK